MTRGDEEEVSVRVAEGHVELHTVGSPGAPIAIDGGEVATARADRVTVERADEAALQALRAAFEEPTIVEAIDDPSGDGASDGASDGAIDGADRGAVHEGSEETAPAERVDPVALAIAAERLYRSGELEAARAAFRRAGTSSESAALRWARLELDAGALDAARTALALHARRHRRGALGAEAAFLGLELAEARGDTAGARAAATAIIERYPGTPQARAAERRLAH